MRAFLHKSEKGYNKDTLKDGIYWWKIVVSVFMGTVLGIFGIRGAVGNVFYIFISFIGINVYVSNYLEVDQETLFGNPSTAMTEGMMPSYAGFLLAWSLFYTLFHCSK